MLLDKVEIQIFTYVIDILTTECKTNAGIKKKIKGVYLWNKASLRHEQLETTH